MNSEPVAPVSRHIGVSDRRKALAFYRDILGFEVRSDDEVVLGPARIMFADHDYGPDSTVPLPRGSSILFFESGDVVAYREAVRARGGAPSGLERVNGIKMLMFEIRDPDGHTLWFGQSYNQPDPAHINPMFEKALPEIAVSDLTVAVEHYRDVLGFKINYSDDNIGVMFRDGVTLLLIPITTQTQGTGSAYFYVRDADALYAEMKSKSAHVLGEPVSLPWGLRQFHVRDNEGNTLKFGQPFE